MIPHACILSAASNRKSYKQLESSYWMRLSSKLPMA